MNVISLDKKTVTGITKRFSATATVGNQHILKTLDDCATQFKTADEVSHLAQAAIRDGLQGQALLVAKKIVCGDEWNSAKLTSTVSQKWLSFLKTVDLIDKRGFAKMNVSYLLDFAGYKEVEEELIKEGVEITPIDTASHFREAKKLSDSKEHGAVATTYTEAVKSNNGVKPSTAKEVVEVVQKSKKKVDSEELFFRDEPQWAERKTGIGAFAVGNVMVGHISPIEKDDWKRFYKTVAKCVHPDKGGSEDDMTILAAMNEMMNVLHKQQEFEQWQKNKLAAYKIWCLNYGCELHDFVVIEDESQ